jgi:hypothetical protein
MTPPHPLRRIVDAWLPHYFRHECPSIVPGPSSTGSVITAGCGFGVSSPRQRIDGVTAADVVPVEVQLMKAELLIPEVPHLCKNSRATHATTFSPSSRQHEWQT